MQNIRSAKKEDVPTILKLIKELAEYEKEPHAVKTNHEDLLRDGFSETPLFQCLIGEVNREAVGFALYFFTWSTWEGRPTLYLEDLYVRESKRGTGLGFSMFKKLAEIAVEKNCSRFEWAVLDWNQSARDFYHKLGAFHKNDWLPYRLEGSSLLNLAKS